VTLKLIYNLGWVGTGRQITDATICKEIRKECAKHNLGGNIYRILVCSFEGIATIVSKYENGSIRLKTSHGLNLTQRTKLNQNYVPC